MTKTCQDIDNTLRDGLESLPEPVELFVAAMPAKPVASGAHVESDDDLDEALRETFPASDPPGSFRTA